MAAVLKQTGKSAAVNLAQQILRPASEKAPTLVFLGPPGVGKGTYSVRVAQLLDMTQVSVGDLVRNEIKANSELGVAVGFCKLNVRAVLCYIGVCGDLRLRLPERYL